MEYQTAQNVRNRSVKELTIRNLVNGQGLIGSYKSAIGSKLKAKATGLQEKFDPLNYINMFNSPLTTAIVGRMFGRKGSTIQYYLDKQKREKTTGRTKIGPGRVTKLKVGDSTPDILAKMFNLMQKDHDEAIKRMELQSEHDQQRRDDEEKRHQELLKAIEMASGGYKEPVKKEEEEEKKKKTLKEKLESMFAEVMKPFKEIGLFFTKVLKFVGESFMKLGEGILKIIETVGEIAVTVFESIGKIALKVIEYIGPILATAFTSVKNLIKKVIEYIVNMGTKIQLGSNSNSGGGEVESAGSGASKRRRRTNYGKLGVSAGTALFLSNLGNEGKNDVLEDSMAGYIKFGTLVGAAAGGISSIAGAGLLAPLTVTAGMMAGSAYGAEFGLLVSSVKSWIWDPAHKFDNKLDMLYYGPEAMDKMETENKKPNDPSVKPIILEYQKQVLVPLMYAEGYEMAPEPLIGHVEKGPHLKRYDEKTMRPIFYKRNDEKELETAKSGDLLVSMTKAIVKREISNDTGIDLNELNKFEDFSKNFVPNAKKFVENDIVEAQGSIINKFENLHGVVDSKFTDIQKKMNDLLSSEGGTSTIVLPTETNTINNTESKDVSSQGTPAMRTMDYSLRQCQFNYAIAC